LASAKCRLHVEMTSPRVCDLFITGWAAFPLHAAIRIRVVGPKHMRRSRTPERRSRLHPGAASGIHRRTAEPRVEGVLFAKRSASCSVNLAELGAECLEPDRVERIQLPDPRVGDGAGAFWPGRAHDPTAAVR